MHVSGGFPLDLNWFLQFILTAFIISLGLLYLVKNTASKYFVVDSNFDSSSPVKMPGFDENGDICAVCSNYTKKQCSGCKMVRYCSEACQRTHWNTGHKAKCKDLRLSGKVNSVQSASMSRERRALTAAQSDTNSGNSKILIKKILFPYEEFLELFNWEKRDFPPCGLLNCGNSCFANVVLQCLTYTHPLVAYLLKKGHRRECRRNDWCFLCEFEIHVERASKSMQAFSPINILSRLPNIGGNLGYGKQEDAHEFMRFAIDTMQSVCLDEFGGEKAVHPTSQETTLIQHIFGGHLQSQVICTKCNNVSNQFENMMDLTVEIHGDAGSLEECLDQFTAREDLHGDNMYKCDGCNEYVQAWKRLTIRRAPNILTIALKRFQSGRFGKLNKRVTFPETLNLSHYMSEEAGDGSDVYRLYAVVVHVDMLNASFFGHYICYTKDFCGNWYRIDDDKVNGVELDEVLSQGAYMLLYSRVCPRPTCLNPLEPEEREEKMEEAAQENKLAPSPPPPINGSDTELIDTASVSDSLISDNSSQSTTENVIDKANIQASSSVSKDIEVHENGGCTFSAAAEGTVCPVEDNHRLLTDIKIGKGADKSSNVEKGVLMDSEMTTENHVEEKGEEASHDVSICTLSSDEVMEETNSELEMVKSRKGLLASSGANHAAAKLQGKNSSGVKPRPLFAPGFLKRPRTRDMKRDGNAPAAEIGESFAACDLNGQSNGSIKPGLPYQNGSKEGKSHFDSGISSSNFLEKQTVKSGDVDRMVAIKYGSLHNGDYGNNIVADGPFPRCDGE
ncbi:hypothetical protein LguiA_036655 [Lonicera macranthoides]